jgi:hypothetical protein
MNVFCNEASCQVLGLENLFFLYCSKKGYTKNRFLVNSRILYMEKNNDLLLKDIRSLLIPHEKEIILIDCENSLNMCSKAYWCLKAAGFTNLKILLDIPENLPMTEGVLEEVSRSESPFLPFNTSIVMTKADLENKTSFYQQLVNMENFEVPNSQDLLQMSSADALQVLQSKGLKFSPSRSSIVFGKFAPVGGILLAWATSRSVSVVIDEIERRQSEKKKNSEDSEEVKKSPAAYSVTIDEHLKSTSVKARPKTERDSAVCANCLVF